MFALYFVKGMHPEMFKEKVSVFHHLEVIFITINPY